MCEVTKITLTLTNIIPGYLCLKDSEMPFLSESHSIEAAGLNPAAVNADVKALISETFNDTDVVIYTDDPVVLHQRSTWTFMVFSCRVVVQEVQ